MAAELVTIRFSYFLYPVQSLKIIRNKLYVFHYRRKFRSTVQEM